MRFNKIPNSLFIKNRTKVLKELKNKSVAIVLSNDRMPVNADRTYKYKQNSEMIYLTGIWQEETVLVLTKDENSVTEEILFILKADKNLKIWEGHKHTIEETKEISGVNKIMYLPQFEMFLKEKIINSDNIYLNLNEYTKFQTPVKDKSIRFVEEIKSKYPLHNYERLAPIITNCRLQKEPEEIELLKKACKITDNAFRRVLKYIKPNIKEYEIEAEITHEFIKSGANDHAYEPIIASGKDNCVLHYISNDKICNEGDLVLMDFGAEYAGYAADTSRTVPVNGKFTERQKDVYNSVLNVMKEAIKLYIPRKTINEINDKVNRLIEKELVNLGLAKEDEILDLNKRDKVRMKYFMHGTAHFIGLDVHDCGSKETVLKPGMVLSCEPGIYIEEENIGIRLENDILITEYEPVDLLADEPIEIEEIEKLMKK